MFCCHSPSLPLLILHLLKCYYSTFFKTVGNSLLYNVFHKAEIKCIASRTLNFSLQTSFRFRFSSSATAFQTSCFLQKTLKDRITLRSQGYNLQEKIDINIRQLQIQMCTLFSKQNYFTICNFIFLFNLCKKYSKRA